MLALTCGIAAGPATVEAAGEEPRVTIVTLPRGTTLSAIAKASPELAVGFLSPGLGTVRVDQTYLDVGQGNRLFNSLYPEPIPPLFVRGGRVPQRLWDRTVERAEEAPAEIVPGLLVRELRAGGVPTGTVRATGSAALLAVAPDGRVDRRSCRLGECPGYSAGSLEREGLRRLIAGLAGDDMLIALERPPPLGRLLAIGIAGRGFEGELRSASTRIDGYVLSTDIAPTILDRYGLEVPSEMSGRVIEGSGAGGDVASLASLAERLEEISTRRHPVIGVNLLIWAALATLASLLWRRRAPALAVAAVAVAFTWVPALLLVTAALEPAELVERLIVGLGAPALALGSLIALRPRFGSRAGFAAFALGASVTVAATAIDVIAGSPLTALSLIGPNPGLGVRFFGIGNELEAVIGTLLALGSGAAVAALRPADPARAVAITVSVAALAAVLVFAPGNFGADVGAAITFPAAAAGVIVAALGAGRRRIALIVAAPIAAVGALIAIDLAIGGDAHLSRSVLEAGGLEELGQVIERRVRLGASSFERFFDSFFFITALVGIVAGVLARERIAGWFEGLPAARAGLIGAIAAAVVGTLANDSGALLLMIGTAYLGAFAGLAWACQRFTSDSESR